MTAEKDRSMAQPPQPWRISAPLGPFPRTFRHCIQLSPLLVLYLMAILLMPNIGGTQDEDRYLMFTKNLARGYYSPPGHVNLWNGPGYPLLLLPFELFGIPWIAARILNGVLLFLAVLSFNATLRLYVSQRSALVFSYLLLGLHAPLLVHLRLLMTEPLMMFLVCSCLFYFCKLQRDDGRRGINVLIAGVLLAYLALTKVFFGYVIMCALLLALVVFLLRRERKDANSLLVCALSFVLCVPWLAYTHSVTGKFLCWGTSGGSALYWMSSSFAGEWGDWRAKQDLEVYPQLALNHGAFVNSLEGLNQVQMDEAFKKKSIENIRQHPTKYLRNCLANIGRLLFNYPYSYAPQTLSSYGYLIPNMFNVVLWVLCLYPSVAGWRRYPYEMIAALVFGAIALFGSSLFSAYLRMGWPVLPLAGLWVAFSLNRVLRIEMRRTDEAAALEP